MFPTIAEYNQTIQAKGGNALKTLSNLAFIPSRTIPVKIYSYGSGSYAVVFKAKDHYSEFAIRCFISAEQENIDRYRKINGYLKNLNATWITKIELLEEEINVGNKHYPVIKMDWIEGRLLNNYVTQIIDDNSALTELQDEIISVSRSLENLKIGHGDIQCGNIIVAKNAAWKNIIKLIDYDGMYIPLFSNKTNLERGRTEFQHPNRSQIQYDEKIDRFSFWVILCALEALKYDKVLWFEVMQGGFNTLDNMLFTGDDFKYFNNSKLANRLYALNKPSLSFYLNKLNKFCNSLPDSIEEPTIFDVGKQDVEDIISQTFQTNNYDRQIEIITNPIGAAVLNSSFQRIGVTPLNIDRLQYLGETLILSYGAQFKQVTIQQNTSVVSIAFNEKIYSPAITNQSNINYENILPSQLQTTPAPIESGKNVFKQVLLGGAWIFFIISAGLLIHQVLTKKMGIHNTYTTDKTTVTVVDRSAPIDNTTVAPAPISDTYEEQSSVTLLDYPIECVVTVDSAHFHTEPTTSSIRNAAWLPYNAKISATKYSNGFAYTVFTNHFRETSYGWIDEGDISVDTTQQPTAYRANFKVTSSEAYFYSHSDYDSKRKSYLAYDDRVTSLAKRDYFLYVVFIDHDGKEYRGWLRMSDLTEVN